MLLIYIQQEKNCFGFVEFESADSVEKAVEVLLFILLFFWLKVVAFLFPGCLLKSWILHGGVLRIISKLNFINSIILSLFSPLL